MAINVNVRLVPQAEGTHFRAFFAAQEQVFSEFETSEKTQQGNQAELEPQLGDQFIEQGFIGHGHRHSMLGN